MNEVADALQPIPLISMAVGTIVPCIWRHLANPPKLKQRAHWQAGRCVGSVGSLRDYMRMWEEYYFYTAAS